MSHNNDAGSLGGQPEVPPQECEEVIGHVEGFLSSDQTRADEQELRESVANAAPELADMSADMSVEALIRTIIKRSCCETAPETLRVRIRTQVTLGRNEG